MGESVDGHVWLKLGMTMNVMMMVVDEEFEEEHEVYKDQVAPRREGRWGRATDMYG